MEFFFLFLQQVQKSHLLFCRWSPMPHLLASNRECRHTNRWLRLSEMFLHHCNSLCLLPVLTCPGASTSGRSIRQKSPRCRIKFPPSLTSTKPTWFGSLWTTPSSVKVVKRGVSISLYPLSSVFHVFMWAFCHHLLLILSNVCYFLFIVPAEDFMNMACSSVLRGGGTNQELVLHCLHECGGDFLVSMVIISNSNNLTADDFVKSLNWYL